MTESTTDAGDDRELIWSDANQAFLKKLSETVAAEVHARAVDQGAPWMVLVAVSAVLADTICSMAVAASGEAITAHARAGLLRQAVEHEIRNRIAQDLEALSRLPGWGSVQ